MTLDEQGGEYLRLKQESRVVDVEIASILAGLRRFGRSLDANAKLIKDDPATWNIDTESFCADFRASAGNAERYRALLGEHAEIRAAIDRYENALICD